MEILKKKKKVMENGNIPYNKNDILAQHKM